MSESREERVQRYFKKSLDRSVREQTWSEDKLTSELANYLKVNHPTIPFTCDMSGVALTKSVARKSASNRAGNYKVPDLLIFVKKGKYGMLCLELKKLSAHPLKKDGTLKKNEHVELQAQSIRWLRKYGQCADFAVGFDDAVHKINRYLTDGEFDYLLKD